MREFELLANEEQIRDMAREFASVRVRDDLLGRGNRNSSDSKLSKTIPYNSTKTSAEQGGLSSGSSQSGDNNIKPTALSGKKKGKSLEQVAILSGCYDEKTPCSDEVHAIQDMARAYYLERDLEQMLLRLYSLAPPPQKESIAELIKIKKVNIERISSEYARLASSNLEYSPNLYNGRDYCDTLLRLSETQERLLGILARVCECTQLGGVTNREIIVATAINRLGIFCYFVSPLRR